MNITNINSAQVKLIMAIAILFFSFALIFVIILMTIPTEKRDIVMVILGFVSGLMTSIVSYYFGSSAGSHKKSEQIDTLTNK